MALARIFKNTLGKKPFPLLGIPKSSRNEKFEENKSLYKIQICLLI